MHYYSLVFEAWGEFKVNNKNNKLKAYVSQQKVLDKVFNSLICYLPWTLIMFLFQVVYSITIYWVECE